MEELPSCGLLIDELPALSVASIRPYVIAILLHRGAVKTTDIIASLIPHCSSDDIRVGGWDHFEDDYCDLTRLEKLIDEVLAEYVCDGILRYNEKKDLWVLTNDDLTTVISWVAATKSRIPQHLSLELGRQQLNRIPSYIQVEHGCN
jgi:hypothetical protein